MQRPIYSLASFKVNKIIFKNIKYVRKKNQQCNAPINPENLLFGRISDIDLCFTAHDNNQKIYILK